jgi:hypothetical protein
MLEGYDIALLRCRRRFVNKQWYVCGYTPGAGYMIVVAVGGSQYFYVSTPAE